MKKFAFTMIELIFVIVVIGILSAMIIPRLDRDTMFEAATQVVNHIKYTQHLAMTEDVYDHTDDDWYMGRWQIQFYACGGYAVSRDTGLNAGLPARSETANDPQTGRNLYTTNICTNNATDYEKVNLSEFFGINNIATDCGTLSFGFDTLGRPYEDLSDANGINGVLDQDCEITLTGSAGTEIVRIYRETGYACILDAAGANCL